MNAVLTVLVLLALAVLLALSLSVRIVKQYEQGVLVRFGRVVGVRQPGLRVIIPFVDVLHRVSMRIVTMPIQSQGIITRDNVFAATYSRVVEAARSVVAIENVYTAIDQIAQTTLRKEVGQRREPAATDGRVAVRAPRTRNKPAGQHDPCALFGAARPAHLDVRPQP